MIILQKFSQFKDYLNGLLKTQIAIYCYVCLLRSKILPTLDIISTSDAVCSDQTYSDIIFISTATAGRRRRRRRRCALMKISLKSIMIGTCILLIRTALDCIKDNLMILKNKYNFRVDILILPLLIVEF